MATDRRYSAASGDLVRSQPAVGVDVGLAEENRAPLFGGEKGRLIGEVR